MVSARAGRAARYALCDGTCTSDCAACKGQGPPARWLDVRVREIPHPRASPEAASAQVTPCVALPGRNLAHTGPCRCFSGGPGPEFTRVNTDSPG